MKQSTGLILACALLLSGAAYAAGNNPTSASTNYPTALDSSAGSYGALGTIDNTDIGEVLWANRIQNMILALETKLGLTNGTTNLDNALDLDAADASLYAANIVNTGNGGGLYVNNAGTGNTLIIADGGAAKITIADSGVLNIDIGLDLDGTDVDINSTATAATAIELTASGTGGGITLAADTGGVDVNLTATGPHAIDGDLTAIGSNGADGDVADGDNDLYVVGVFENDTEIEADGPIDLDNILDVNADDPTSYAADIVNASDGGGLFVNSEGAGNIARFDDDGSAVVTIADGGAVTMTGTLGVTSNINTTSGAYQVGGVQISTSNLSDGANVAHINAVETLASNWVNTANPWADNEVADDLTITAGTIENSIIGAATPAAGSFSTVTASGDVNTTAGVYKVGGSQISTSNLSDGGNVAHINAVETLSGNWVNTTNPWADNEVAPDLTVTAGTIENSIIGAATPAAGTFTSLTASGAVTLGDSISDLINVYSQMRTYDGSDNWVNIADVSALPRGNGWHCSYDVEDFAAAGQFQALFANTQVTDATLENAEFYGIEGKATLKTSVATGTTTGIGVMGKISVKTTATLPEAYGVYSRLETASGSDEITSGVNFMADIGNSGTMTSVSILSCESGDTYTTGIDLSPGAFTTDLILGQGGTIHNTDANNVAITEANINAVGRLTTTDGVASGTARVVGGLAYSQTAASTAVTNATTVEQYFDKTYSVPADTLKAGTVVHLKLAGIVTGSASTDTLTIKLYIGSTALVTTAAVDSEDNDIWYADVDVLVRTAGGSGTFVAIADYQDPDAGTLATKRTLTGSTAIDTTGANVIRASATWSATNATCTCRQDILTVEIL